MLWHLESAGEASRLRDVNTEPLYIQSMLTVMSLTFVSGILFWYLEEEGQKELL